MTTSNNLPGKSGGDYILFNSDVVLTLAQCRPVASDIGQHCAKHREILGSAGSPHKPARVDSYGPKPGVTIGVTDLRVCSACGPRKI